MIIIASYSNVSVTYTADGTQTVFSFPFDYLRKAFVYVEVNEETILTQGTDYTVSEKTVVFATAPASGTVLRIYRETDTTRLVSWADASVLKASDMTVQQVQELHILEEQEYWTKENTIVRNGHEWNARHFPIKNTGDPVDPKDATTKEYVDDELDTAIENLQLLADIVVDSEELQHITDQFNAIDENAEIAANAAETAVDSAASANTSKNSASASATAATNTANALINFLETKETLTAPAVDPALTISGAAADAKVTGDKFGKQTITWTEGKYIRDDGTIGTHGSYSVSSPIYLAGNSLHLKTRMAVTTYYVIAFYKADGTFISGVYHPDAGVTYTYEADVPIPSDAYYARATCIKNNVATMFSIEIYNVFSVLEKVSNDKVFSINTYNSIKDFIDDSVFVEWEVGSIYGGTGTNYDNTRSIRTPDNKRLYIDADTKICFLDERIELFYAFKYNAPTGGFVERIGVEEGKNYITLTAGYYWRIAAIYPEDFVISSAEVSSYSAYIYMPERKLDSVLNLIHNNQQRIDELAEAQENLTDYSISVNFHKNKCMLTQLGQLSKAQSFCIYNNKYYSAGSVGILSTQNLDFTPIQDYNLWVGHANSFQLGHNGMAYISGWDDGTVYCVNLATMTIASTITLPVTGRGSVVVDDLSKIAYIIYRANEEDNISEYTFTAYDYVNEQIIMQKKLAPFGLIQACDYLNGKILVASGNGTSGSPNGFKMYNTNGDMLCEFVLGSLTNVEPEGIFIDRNTFDIYVSFIDRYVYKLSYV